jgi:hypothetical protein
MGGATISKDGETPQLVLEQLREEILAAFPNLQPDSDASLFNLATKETKLFKVYLKGPDDNIKVEFEEISAETKVNLATAAAIEVTMNYHKTPKKGWVGCVHLHT